jgi:hypothetical protein
VSSLQTISRSSRCPTCGRRRKRTTDANARYWLLLHKISDEYRPDGQQFSAKTWHLQCRKHWLGCDDATLPTGETMSIPRSTADLSVDEFSDYMTAVEAWANARGVWLDE